MIFSKKGSLIFSEKILSSTHDISMVFDLKIDISITHIHAYDLMNNHII